ncbi:MAG TPA: hypothetical protein VGB94_05370 [Acidobacteriaceae bacterium]
MHLSIGWIFLLGGIAGLIRNARAKSITWANTVDINMTPDEIRQSEVPMTPKRRLIALTLCLALAIFGAWKIQRDHWWNPFLGHPSDRQVSPQREKDDGAMSRNEFIAPNSIHYLLLTDEV